MNPEPVPDSMDLSVESLPNPQAAIARQLGVDPGRVSLLSLSMLDMHHITARYLLKPDETETR